MNYHLLSLLILIIFGGCENKPIKNIEEEQFSLLSNSRVEYSIVIMSCDTCAPIKNIGYRVVVDLSKNQELIVKHLQSEQWIKLLKSNTNDWAANLILYSLNDKDALILSRIKDIETWRKYQKNEDVDDWLIKFKSTRK